MAKCIAQFTQISTFELTFSLNKKFCSIFFFLKHLKTLISKVGYKSMQLARTSVSRMVRHQCLGCPRNPNAVMRKHLFQRLFTFVLYDSELDGCKSRKGISVNNVFIHAVDTFYVFFTLDIPNYLLQFCGYNASMIWPIVCSVFYTVINVVINSVCCLRQHPVVNQDCTLW